jgi:hypothetical protein
MLKNLKSLLKNATVVGSLAIVGCGAPMTAPDGGMKAGCPAADAGCPAGCPARDAGCPAGCPALTMGDAQTPPMNSDPVISAWLAGGAYKAWKCEPAGHAGRGSSPHGRNRICNNTALTNTASGNYPAGAASVKELLVADGGTAVVGYAIGLKATAGASTGASWYWYLKNGGMLVTNGKGTMASDDGCSSCHRTAGPGTSGRDFVFTQVP